MSKVQKKVSTSCSLKRHEKISYKDSHCAKQFETLFCLNNYCCFLIISKEEPPMKKCKPNSAETTNGDVYFFILFVYLKIMIDFSEAPQAI